MCHTQRQAHLRCPSFPIASTLAPCQPGPHGVGVQLQRGGLAAWHQAASFVFPPFLLQVLPEETGSRTGSQERPLRGACAGRWKRQWQDLLEHRCP